MIIIISLFLLGVLGMGRCSEEDSTLVNVAMRGSAVQSSTYRRGVAKRAIDGSRQSNYEEGSCSHTDGGTNSWWRVDLLDTYAITSITITNRDTVPDRVNRAEIRIGNSLDNNGNSNPRCAVISSIPAGGTTTFQCNGMQGRYVNVFLRGYMQYLTLCEVEVYAHPVPIDIRPTVIPEQELMPWKLENKALGKPAEQSSEYNFKGHASNAVDGKGLSWYKDQSCSRTKTQANPWWRVDLQEKYNITSVTIANTEEMNPEMIDGAEIRIGNSLMNNGNRNPLCAVISSYPAWEVMTFQCRGMEGRYVNIFLPGCDKHLALCEVEVNVGRHRDDEFLPPITKTDPGNKMKETLRGQDILCQDSITPYANAATGGTATQSTQRDDNGGAGNAVDQNRGNVYTDGSCSHTRAEQDPWWRVELAESHNVTYVSITNRGDCCSERINGAEIHVGDSLVNNGNGNPLCAVIPYIPLGQTRTFPCGGMEGRYVNILLPGREKYLSLCEVEVHATTFKQVIRSASPVLTPNPYLTWLWEPMRLFRTPAVRRGNVALTGRATQSSQFSQLTHAENAIDGRLDTEYLSGSCAHTRLQSDPWWRVDLLAAHTVTSVTVTNREDCCPWRLDGAQILVGNSLKNNGNSNPVCAVISSIPAGDSVSYQCRGMRGRYINIIRPGCSKFLTLCEVEVHAEPLPGTNQEEEEMHNEEELSLETQCPVNTVPDNLATAGQASQSSRFNDLGAASNAIDRKQDPVYYSGSCTHTDEETNPWWRVDLLDTYSVSSVTITNRGDCCRYRINRAHIYIGQELNRTENTLCAVIPEMREGQTIEFSCKEEMEGRFVTIVLPGPRRVLTLCEVEVHGALRKDSN